MGHFVTIFPNLAICRVIRQEVQHSWPTTPPGWPKGCNIWAKSTYLGCSVEGMNLPYGCPRKPMTLVIGFREESVRSHEDVIGIYILH